MKSRYSAAVVLVALAMVAVRPIYVRADDKPDAEGFYSLFDGKSLDGWKASEIKDAWAVEDGNLVAKSGRSHLFYDGPVHDHNWKNFELKAEVMTKPGANSGIYFHTEYQETDWPFHGFEAQINNTHTDWKRTGSLYDVVDIRESPAKDDEWFPYDILVQDKHIVLTVNGKQTVDYTEPEGGPKVADKPGRMLSHGTIALQGHDPKSETHFKNIRIKTLP
jgi:hypothetical protein